MKLQEIKEKYDFYKRRYERALNNEKEGVYLWSKMSEHNAEMYYLKYNMEDYKKMLEELSTSCDAPKELNKC